MKFTKDKCQTMHLRWNNHASCYDTDMGVISQGAALQLFSKEISASSASGQQLKLSFSWAIWTTYLRKMMIHISSGFVSPYAVTKFSLQSPSMAMMLAISRSLGVVTGSGVLTLMRRCYEARTWSRDSFRAPSSNPMPLEKESRGWNLPTGACKQEIRQ